MNRALRICGAPHIEVSNGQYAVDFHVHTLYSHCSISRPEDILLKADRQGLAGIAIMDHHSVAGALATISCAEELKRRGLLSESFVVIPGVELNSTVGHIGALFVTEDLPEKEPPLETVKAIHGAGGLAIAVHPYHSTGIGDAVFDAPFDAVEVECGSVFHPKLVQLNRALVSDPRMRDVAKIGGSDAHYLNALASCYTVVSTEANTLEALRQAIMNRKCTAHSTIALRRMRRLLGVIPKLR